MDAGRIVIGLEVGELSFEVSIYRKFKNSFPRAIRPESGIVGRATLKGAAIPAL